MRPWQPNCPAQEQLSIDETGTNEATASLAVDVRGPNVHGVCGACHPRGHLRLTAFLGEAFHGVVNCDRAKMYWHLGCLQWCWGRSERDFQAMIDSGDPRGETPWLALAARDV